MKRVYGVLIVLVALMTSAFGQKPGVVTSNEPGWQKIGETVASFKMQTESIVVLGADKFSSIKLKVTDAPITIERLQVVYESGEVQDIEVRNKLNEGAETRSIDIQGNEDIQKVVFTYKTVANAQDEKAHIELHGLKTGEQSNFDAYRNEKRDVNEAADKTDKEIDKATKEADRDVNETANEVDRDIEKAAENTQAEAKETEVEVKDGVDKVGDKISEAAANAAAEVNDQMFIGKMGPKGQNIYIDKNDKSYYINDEGRKVYISKSALKDKPKND